MDKKAEQVKNEIIGQAPETLDTLKEIADALGDPDNIAGNVVNKLVNHDSLHEKEVGPPRISSSSAFARGPPSGSTAPW